MRVCEIVASLRVEVRVVGVPSFMYMATMAGFISDGKVPAARMVR